VNPGQTYLQDRISVWPFHEAPAELRALSSSGGDEDWVILVPTGMLPDGLVPSWVDRTDSMMSPERIDVEGFIVFIGGHA